MGKKSSPVRKGTRPGKPPKLGMPGTYADQEKGKTNVQITIETKDRLVALGGKGDSYDDVIKRLLDEACRHSVEGE